MKSHSKSSETSSDVSSLQFALIGFISLCGSSIESQGDGEVTRSVILKAACQARIDNAVANV